MSEENISGPANEPGGRPSAEAARDPLAASRTGLSVSRSISVPYVDPGLSGPGSDKLGRYSMYLAIAVFVLSAVASALIGLFGTTIYHYHQTIITDGHSATSAGFNARPNQVAFLIQIVSGTILGVGAIVLGIVAAARGRGRRFGVVAIVVAALAPVVSVVLFAVIGLAAGHNVTQ